MPSVKKFSYFKFHHRLEFRAKLPRASKIKRIPNACFRQSSAATKPYVDRAIRSLSGDVNIRFPKLLVLIISIQMRKPDPSHRIVRNRIGPIFMYNVQ